MDAHGSTPLFKQEPIILRPTNRPMIYPGTPIMSRGVSEAPGSCESSEYVVDASQIHSLCGQRYSYSRSEITLPFASSFAASSGRVPAPKEFPNIFDDSALSTFFDAIEEQTGTSIPAPLRNKIRAIVTHALGSVLRGSIQESRRSMNCYCRPPSERELTSCPKISHHFILQELCYSNFVRRSKYNHRETDGEEPTWFCDQTIINAQVFPAEMTNETTEQKLQTQRIYQTLRVRGLFFKSVAGDVDHPHYGEEIDRLMQSNPCGPRPTPTFNPRAAEILMDKEGEERRQAARQIRMRDVVGFLESCSPQIRSFVPALLRERYVDAED